MSAAVNFSYLVYESCFANSCQLVSHCFVFRPFQCDKSFARIKAANFAGQRYHLHTIQELISSIIAYNYSRTLFAYFAAY